MEFRIVPAGDAALVIELPALIDPEISSHAVGLSDAIRTEYSSLILDVVVGYATVTVYFDPLRADGGALERELERLASRPRGVDTLGRGVIDVPVCYGGEEGPDLASVASTARLSEAEVIAIHSGAVYRVYVIGFIPGFPYMASVDSRLALPRRASPRTRVPAGSVAIAAGQTGIYPAETPGGWHLIGRTALKPYDASREEPCAFRAGDTVRFHPVDREAFLRESQWS